MPSNEAVIREEESPDFEALFHEHYPAVFKFFRRRGFAPPESEELAQETFLKVHQGLDRFRREANPWTWIFIIASNVFRNEVRRRHTHRRRGWEVPLEKPSADGEESSAELRREVSVPASQAAEVMARQELSLVVGAVEDLPPRMRQVFRLRMMHGWKYDDIARETRVSVQTVKSQIHQARRRLLTHLEERNH